MAHQYLFFFFLLHCHHWTSIPHRHLCHQNTQFRSTSITNWFSLPKKFILFFATSHTHHWNHIIFNFHLQSLNYSKLWRVSTISNANDFIISTMFHSLSIDNIISLWINWFTFFVLFIQWRIQLIDSHLTFHVQVLLTTN